MGVGITPDFTASSTCEHPPRSKTRTTLTKNPDSRLLPDKALDRNRSEADSVRGNRRPASRYSCQPRAVSGRTRNRSSRASGKATGLGCSLSVAIPQATENVGPDESGVGSAAVSTITQLGGALGTALLNTIAAAVAAAARNSTRRRPRHGECHRRRLRHGHARRCRDPYRDHAHDGGDRTAQGAPGRQSARRAVKRGPASDGGARRVHHRRARTRLGRPGEQAAVSSKPDAQARGLSRLPPSARQRAGSANRSTCLKRADPSPPSGRTPFRSS